MDMTTILQDKLNMYNAEYDVVQDIKIIGDLNNKLFCTFTDLDGLDHLIKDIQSKYTIIYNKLLIINYYNIVQY